MTTLHTMVGAALAAVCAFPLAAQQGNAQPPKPTIVAVVDIERAIDTYPRWLDYKEQLQQMYRAAEVRMNELKKELDEAKARIDITDAGSLERKQAQFDFDQIGAKREWEFKFMRERIDVANAQFATICFQDVGEVVEKIAKARGVQLVHRIVVDDAMKADPLTMPPGKLVTLSRALDSRQIWYSAPEIDITNDVMKELQVWKPKEKPTKGDKADAAGNTNGAKPDAAKPEPASGDPKGTNIKGGG